jgi:hypothetical protein
MYEKGAHLLPSSVYRGSHMTRKARFTVFLVVLAFTLRSRFSLFRQWGLCRKERHLSYQD